MTYRTATENYTDRHSSFYRHLLLPVTASASFPCGLGMRLWLHTQAVLPLNTPHSKCWAFSSGMQAILLMVGGRAWAAWVMGHCTFLQWMRSLIEWSFRYSTSSCFSADTSHSSPSKPRLCSNNWGREGEEEEEKENRGRRRRRRTEGGGEGGGSLFWMY